MLVEPKQFISQNPLKRCSMRGTDCTIRAFTTITLPDYLAE